MWEYNTDYLSHHGIKGQKWGLRRFQNEDGTYTKEGKARRNAAIGAGLFAAKSVKDSMKNLTAANLSADMLGIARVPVGEAITKTALAAGKFAVVGAIATYGATKAVDFIKSKTKNKDVIERNKKKGV